MIPIIETERLILRGWSAADRKAFARMNADPVVMEFFPTMLTEEESNASVDRIEQHFVEHGFGLWVLEVKEVTPFAGFVGLATPRFKEHFTPCVEIGWRLDQDYWRQGYATEGAKAVLVHAFSRFGLREVISMTATLNKRSERIMQKIGMTHDPNENFEHPLVPAGHPLCEHVLYRIQKPVTVNQ